MKKTKVNNKYSFENYKPNKNCKPVEYKGTKYLSKAQCIALEGITRKELEEYLKGETISETPALDDIDLIDNILA